MNKKSLQTLEFDKVLLRLKDKAIGSIGKELCTNLIPVANLGEIEEQQQQTSEAVGMIVKRGSLPLGGIKDIRPALQRVNVNGLLSILELMHIGDFLYVCRKAANYGKDDKKQESFPLLEPMFTEILPLTQLEKEITRCIVNEQEIADDASGALYTIRKNIRVAHDKIKESLNSIIHSGSYKNILQDTVITMRSQRYCVPVKLEYKNSFPGVVHDQSSTGATVFMEPLSVVNLNNKIRELASQEKEEVERILWDLSRQVEENSQTLADNLQVLSRLDFIFAKGELSLEMNGTEPELNLEGKVYIKNGRHPLLSPDKVVPTNIYLGDTFTTLLITGPNTGGKTVTLKTLGLLTLMGQSGLHIPASDHSQLAVFDQVFADIGDEQSIEQSLSTFSSHMSNIVNMLAEISDRSLVLLDELGAGTDPTEGAALAIAVLQYLYQRQIRTAVTTHYSELKVYALSTEGVENASCEFDVATLRPTYKLLIGIPGKSNAFEISRRLGLPEHIINDAKELLSQQDKQFEDVITDLEISKKTAELEKAKAEEFRHEAERMKAQFEEQKKKLEQQRDKYLRQAKEEAFAVVNEAKEEADRLLKELQKQMREQSGHKNMEETRKKIKAKLTEYQQEDQLLSGQHAGQPLKNAKKGDNVYIGPWRQSGIALTDMDASGNVMVQAGVMKMKMKITDLYRDKQKKTESGVQYSGGAKVSKARNMTPEVDLRGLMVEEGLTKLDKYLDDAYLSGLQQVTIIHGKGTGVLRTAVQNHLRSHPHVTKYRLGEFGEGDAGVTVASLK